MPLVTLTLPAGRPEGFARALLDATHAALVEAGVPAADRFQRVIELPESRLVVDPRFPDLTADRADRFALIEILWSVGRNVKVKRRVVADIVNGVARAGGDPEQTMIVFIETAWENWAFGGGRLLNA